MTDGNKAVAPFCLWNGHSMSFTLWGHNFNLWCKPHKCAMHHKATFPYSAFKEWLAHISHKLTFDVPKR